jgi:hypothetical protein
MARRTRRKIELFEMSGHVMDRPLDYHRALALVHAEERGVTLEQGPDSLLALGPTEWREERLFLVIYEGPREALPLIFDYSIGEERYEQLQDSEFQATRTHALLDPDTRRATIEYNHRGAKADDVAYMIEDIISRRLAPDATFELTISAYASFGEAVSKFDRIRVASARFTRPNQSWDEHYEKFLDLASESDGQDAEVAVYARRKKSLSKNHGLVPFIVRIATTVTGVVKNARITGQKPDEGAETTVSLENHQIHQRVQVPMEEGGHVSSEAIAEHLEELLRDEDE